jgi:hypothetical protein
MASTTTTRRATTLEPPPNLSLPKSEVRSRNTVLHLFESSKRGANP